MTNFSIVTHPVKNRLPGERVDQHSDDDGGNDGADEVDGGHDVDLCHGRLGEVGDVGGVGRAWLGTEIYTARHQCNLVHFFLLHQTLGQYWEEGEKRR